jgi:hypothetical protein
MAAIWMLKKQKGTVKDKMVVCIIGLSFDIFYIIPILRFVF